MSNWRLILVWIVMPFLWLGSHPLEIQASNIFTRGVTQKRTLLPPDSTSNARTRRNVSPRPIDPERKQLMGDALNWLTLRSNGNPLSQSQLKPFHDTIISRYSNSKFYRTFVIAFQHGILSKLTLNENSDCDPSAFGPYRDPYNNSFSYYYQNKFIFKNYKGRINNNNNLFPYTYCDYRQGLICSPATSKCECPEGGEMETLQSSSPPTQRCVMKKDYECTLPDLTHDKGGDHSILKGNIHRLVFNLEKPISCMTGTVCRIGAKDGGIFRCHDAGSNQWASPDMVLSYMDECSLDVLANPGMCAPIKHLGGYGNTVCYDYGPRAKPGVNGVKVPARTGFCSLHYGNIGASPDFFGSGTYSGGIATYVDPFLVMYVSPRTIPMRGDMFRRYQDDVIQMTHRSFLNYNNGPGREGQACSVTKTEQLEELFKFYSGLEDEPTAGESFVATETQLNSKLKELQTVLSKSSKSLSCKFWWRMVNTREPLACVATGAAEDAKGNDGICQKSTSNWTRPYLDTLEDHLDLIGETHSGLKYEENYVDINILQRYPEPPLCSVEKSNAPEGQPPTEYQDHKHFDLVPGTNICPRGSVCYEDLHDSHGIYKKQQGADFCEFVTSYVPEHICHSNSLGLMLETCEDSRLEEKVKKAKYDLHKLSKLERGAECDYSAERIVRTRVSLAYDRQRFNPYVFLSMVERGRKAKGGFCDATKMLTCSTGNRCECTEGTGPRATEDWQIKSDYCYWTSGWCLQDLEYAVTGTERERDEARRHYAYSHPNDKIDKTSCNDTNVCVLVNEERQTCIDGPWNAVVTTTTKRTPSGPSGPNGPSGGGGGIGRPTLYAGAREGKKDASGIKIIFILILLYLF